VKPDPARVQIPVRGFDAGVSKHLTDMVQRPTLLEEPRTRLVSQNANL
jgi:hypothetical protein